MDKNSLLQIINKHDLENVGEHYLKENPSHYNYLADFIMKTNVLNNAKSGTDLVNVIYDNYLLDDNDWLFDGDYGHVLELGNELFKE